MCRFSASRFEVLDDSAACPERASYVLRLLLFWVGSLDQNAFEDRLARLVMLGNTRRRADVPITVVRGWAVKRLHASRGHRSCRGHWQVLVDELLKRTGYVSRDGVLVDTLYWLDREKERLSSSVALLKFLIAESDSPRFWQVCYDLYNVCNHYCSLNRICVAGVPFLPHFADDVQELV
jgi:hypothetical protein